MYVACYKMYYSSHCMYTIICLFELYCIVLYCIVFYCSIVLYCIVLYCIVTKIYIHTLVNETGPVVSEKS